MNLDAYEEFLHERNLEKAEIERQLYAVQAFEDWLGEQGTDLAAAGKETIGRYARRMIADGSNTIENLYALCRYAYWRGLRKQYIDLVEVTDCHNGMEVLRDIILKQHGAEIRDGIFREPLPPLGADEAERFSHTKKITGRMNEALTKQQIRAALFQVQHGIPSEHWQKQDAEEKEKYGDCETLGAFLSKARIERNQMLTHMHDEGKLWFTMELTDDVLQFLVSEAHMRLGEHNGRKGIVITKVPYRAELFLRETDERLKRYYACHCPLIREAILNGETLPDDVCYCSLGHASHFLAGMGLENLEGEVIESAVKGDARCKFIFYLPEEKPAS
jgi:hypothetical protein